MAQALNTTHSKATRELRALPQHASLEHLKSEAKTHLKALQAQQPEAKLADAQLEIARRYGFPSWRALKAHVEPRPIDIQGMAPLLWVFDMPASIAFYRDVLGFKIMQAARWSPEVQQWLRTRQKEVADEYGWARLRLKTIELMLNTLYEPQDRPAEPDPGRIKTERDVTLYFSCRSVDEAYQYLRSRGVAADPPATSYYGMKQLTLRDPDGYTICFQHPADREA